MAQKRKPSLRKVTLREFFEGQGDGGQKRMAAEVGVSKSTICNLAAEPARGFASYAVAKRIRAHMEAHGFTIDLESLVRTESARP